MSGAFVVENPAMRDGVRVGTMRVYVATEERARSLAAETLDRTYRAIALADMPAHAREAMEVTHG